MTYVHNETHDGVTVVREGEGWDAFAPGSSDGFLYIWLPKGVNNVSIHIFSDGTGDRAGAIKARASNYDLSEDRWANISFEDSSGSAVTSLTVTGSTPFNQIVNLKSINARYVSIWYDRTSGTMGTFDAYVAIKKGA